MTGEELFTQMGKLEEFFYWKQNSIREILFGINTGSSCYLWQPVFVYV